MGTPVIPAGLTRFNWPEFWIMLLFTFLLLATMGALVVLEVLELLVFFAFVWDVLLLLGTHLRPSQENPGCPQA